MKTGFIVTVAPSGLAGEVDQLAEWIYNERSGFGETDRRRAMSRKAACILETLKKFKEDVAAERIKAYNQDFLPDHKDYKRLMDLVSALID